MTPGTVQDLMSSSILGSTRSTWGVLQMWMAMENPRIVLVDLVNLVDFAEESHLQIEGFSHARCVCRQRVSIQFLG